MTHNPRSVLFRYQLRLFRSIATKKRTIAPPQAVAQAATGPSFLLTKKGGKDVPKGVPPLGIPPLCRGCSVRYAHLRTAAQATPHGTGAPLTLRNVPAGWSHKLSAGHRDILGRLSSRTQMPPLTAFASGNGCPVIVANRSPLTRSKGSVLCRGCLRSLRSTSTHRSPV